MSLNFKFLIILVFCCYSSVKANATSIHQIDSLKSMLSTNISDSLCIRVLNELSKASRYSNQADAIDFAIKAEKLSEKTENQKGLAFAFHNIAVIYTDKLNNELALGYHFKSLKISELINDKHAIANSCGNIGLIYHRDKNYKEAISFHTRSLNIKKELFDTVGIAYSYSNLGLTYSAQEKYDKALIQLYNALRIKESLNDKYGMANSYSNIGIIFFNIENYAQSEQNLKKGLDLFNEINNQTGIAVTQIYLGEIYYKKELFHEAFDAFSKCLDLYTEKNDTKGMADSYLRLGNVNQSLGKTDTAEQNLIKGLELYQDIQNNEGMAKTKIELAKCHLKKHKYEQAKADLEVALRFSKREKLINQQSEALSLLTQIYLTLDNSKKTAQYFSESKVITDSIYKLAIAKEIAQIKIQDEFKELNRERERQKKNNQILEKQKKESLHKFFNIFIVCISIILIGGILSFRSLFLLTRKKQTLETQILSLSEQLILIKYQKKELEQNSHTKNIVLSIINNYVKKTINPINNILADITEYDQKIDDVVLKKHHTLINKTITNSQKALKNLLEWSLNQAGEMIATIENISLNNILEENILLLKELAQQKDINISISLDGNPVVAVDKNMIDTVIRNIISNAIKFTLIAGSINIVTKINENFVEVIIKDTGIGMSKEQIRDIFLLDKMKKTPDGRMSVESGLILCKYFLKKHSQKLNVESSLNEGTKLWFSLPLSKA